MPKCKYINKISMIGSGPIIIGQACEFGYSGFSGRCYYCGCTFEKDKILIK